MALHILDINSWEIQLPPSELDQAINALEDGKVINLPKLNFSLETSEKKLLSPEYVDHGTKNISYNLLTNELRGTKADAQEKIALQNLLQRFAQQSKNLVDQLFPTYTKQIQIGRTSFRPVEIENRISPSYKKDDTRFHVDAFPANPNQGRRILRVFSNINNAKTRHWRVGQSFQEVAQKFLPKIQRQIPGTGSILKALRITKSLRTPYDHIMLQIHDRMKKDMEYQTSIPFADIHFQPQTSWIVYTDIVSHAAISGQHVLEQTFYLPVNAMNNPNKSPLKILEQMTNTKLI